MLERLKRKGLLRFYGGKIRINLRNTPSMSEQTVEVPLVGSVTCGSPALAEQDVQAVIQVSVRLAKPGHRYFLLRASGNSMNKSGILDRDLVLVRQQATTNEGDKVVALIDDEATIKHFRCEQGVVVLMPNSTVSRYMPIVMSNEFPIHGVVVKTLPDPL